MSLSNDIPTKLRLPAQLPLDAKTSVATLSQLQTLGTNDNLAFTYYKNMRVDCAENNFTYQWRPAGVGETGGLLASNFVYPSGIVSEDGIVYSGIAYNFFKVLQPEDVVVNLDSYQVANITGIGKGVYHNITNPSANVIQFNMKKLKSTDNSILITEDNEALDFKINQNWLLQFLTENKEFICGLISTCGDPDPDPGIITAVNDYAGTLSANTDTEVDVMANDNKGTLPTNIISINPLNYDPIATGIDVYISLDNQKVVVNMGEDFISGFLYQVEYTIQDSTLATSTAILSFEDVS